MKLRTPVIVCALVLLMGWATSSPSSTTETPSSDGGPELWHDDAGSQIVTPLFAYAIGDTEYISAVVGVSESTAAQPAEGSVPYTPAQLAAGKMVYEKQCLSCHGAQLQGVSAPALTGPSFGHAHLNVSTVRTIVTTQMPLGVPGSLTPDQYAAVMSYLMAYNCIKPANGGTKPFPTTDLPANKTVTFTGATCQVK